jgi:8-oxo-dGTP diphosphatase
VKKKFTYDYPRPSVTADVVLVAGGGEERHILLIRRKKEPFAGKWALPGGFVDENEKLEKAAARELEEETGVRLTTKLRQIGAFGDPGRDPRGHTVSIAFLAEARRTPKIDAGDDASDARWFPLNKLPPLAFDHRKIVRAALALLTD